MNETKIMTIFKKLNTGDSKGRKLKPGAKLPFAKTIESQLNGKNNNIVTAGVFALLPADIAKKIHDKKLVDDLSYNEIQLICGVILLNRNNNNCFVHLTETGELLLKNLILDPTLYNKKTLMLRNIFITQERQLVL